jgi:hypothetical protein
MIEPTLEEAIEYMKPDYDHITGNKRLDPLIKQMWETPSGELLDQLAAMINEPGKRGNKSKIAATLVVLRLRLMWADVRNNMHAGTLTPIELKQVAV